MRVNSANFPKNLTGRLAFVAKGFISEERRQGFDYASVQIPCPNYGRHDRLTLFHQVNGNWAKSAYSYSHKPVNRIEMHCHRLELQTLF
jgi:hypothetical protein